MNQQQLKAALARWNHPGAAGFLSFIEDIKPRVPSANAGTEIYVPTDWEREEFTRALDGDHNTLVWCWPRRHGKTLANALIVVWRFMSRPSENIAIVANSEKQVLSTCFRTIKGILEQTPALAAQVKSSAIIIGADKIERPATGSVIAAYSSTPASLWGKKLTVAQISEAHEIRNPAVLTALAGSLIDTRGSVLLIDSTVGARKSALYGLYELHQKAEDPKLYFSHIQYADIDDACTRSPAWIDPAQLRSLAKKMLPSEFALYHLNRWQDASNALFPIDVLDRCRLDYAMNVPELTKGAGHVVGAGLDRARPFSKHGDATVTTCVLKVVQDDDDHFFVLASDQVRLSMASGIKARLTDYHRHHGMSRVVLESYETADLSAWCGDQRFNHEAVHPNTDKQVSAFTTLYSAAAEGRLHIAPQFKKLFDEMSIFEYEVRNGGTMSFSHPPGCHDDHVYSLAWAIYALRDVELNPYEMTGIACNASGPVIRLCCLNGGDLLPMCADQCRSAHTALKLYDAYTSRAGCAPMKFDDFFRTKVVNTGSHTLRR